MKENLKYQIKFYFDTLLKTCSFVYLAILILMFILQVFFSPNDVGPHFYGFSIGFLSMLSLGIHISIIGTFLHLAVTFGGTRKQWFIVSAIYKILFSVVLVIVCWFLTFLITQILENETINLQINDLFISFIVILLFSCVGEFTGVLISRYGRKAYAIMLGCVFVSSMSYGILSAREDISISVNIQIELYFIIPAVIIFLGILQFIIWRFIRKQEVNI